MANYYVSKLGNDTTGDGSESKPWLTIQKALNVVTTAPNVIWVKQGTYNEMLWFKGSGSGSNYIELKVYPGDAVTIDGTGLTTTYNGVISCFSRHHIIIDGFTVCNGGYNHEGDYSGIYVGTENYGATGYVTIRNCTVYNTYNSGIMINTRFSYAGGTKMQEIYIDNCIVHNTNHGGGNEGISLIAIDGFEIKNCKVYDIEGNDHYANNKECIDAKDGCINGSIHHNECYAGRIGIYIDGYGYNSTNIDIYCNYCHDCEDGNASVGTGIAVAEEQGGADVTDINIFNNILANNITGGFYAGSYNSDYTFTLINNTFYKNGTEREIWIPSAATYTSCVIRNNIFFVEEDAVPIAFQDGGETGFTIDHNLFWDEVNGSTIAAGNQEGTDFVKDNPDFEDAAADDFHLQAGSPAIDAGNNTGAPDEDYDGVIRPKGTDIVDIGAFEVATLGDGDIGSANTWIKETVTDIVVINYTGTWLTYPTIKITGPLSDFSVENLSTGEWLEFNYNLLSGRVLTINLAYGVKTVVDDLGNNLIGTLSTDSDLATFHIAPDPEVPGGVNNIQLSGNDGVDGETNVEIEYYTRYIGI